MFYWLSWRTCTVNTGRGTGQLHSCIDRSVVRHGACHRQRSSRRSEIPDVQWNNIQESRMYYQCWISTGSVKSQFWTWQSALSCVGDKESTWMTVATPNSAGLPEVRTLDTVRDVDSYLAVYKLGGYSPCILAGRIWYRLLACVELKSN